MLLVRVEDGAAILARPGDGDPVSALGWDTGGTTVAYGTEAGRAGVLRL